MQYTDIQFGWYMADWDEKTFPQYESCANSIQIECIAFYVHFVVYRWLYVTQRRI